MTMFMSGNHLEFYFLPAGGREGYDEVALHSSLTSFELNRDGDPYHLLREHVRIDTFGDFRPLDEKLLKPGTKGILTVLDRKPSSIAFRVPLFITGLEISYPYNYGLELGFDAQVVGPQEQGTYEVKRQWGRVRIDQGDGTFLEVPQFHVLTLDELINNRGWV